MPNVHGFRSLITFQASTYDTSKAYYQPVTQTATYSTTDSQYQTGATRGVSTYLGTGVCTYSTLHGFPLFKKNCYTYSSSSVMWRYHCMFLSSIFFHYSPILSSVDLQQKLFSIFQLLSSVIFPSCFFFYPL